MAHEREESDAQRFRHKTRGKRGGCAQCSDSFTRPPRMHRWDPGQAPDTTEVWKVQQQAKHPCPWVADALVQETEREPSGLEYQ